LRVLFLIPIGAILALIVLYGMPWWVLGLMAAHTCAILWLVWFRMTHTLKVDRDD
jgi:hypothetical protein